MFRLFRLTNRMFRLVSLTIRHLLSSLLTTRHFTYIIICLYYQIFWSLTLFFRDGFQSFKKLKTIKVCTTSQTDTLLVTSCHLFRTHISSLLFILYLFYKLTFYLEFADMIDRPWLQLSRYPLSQQWLYQFFATHTLNRAQRLITLFYHALLASLSCSFIHSIFLFSLL